MPIKIPVSLPAASVLENENIFIMDEARATTQDIRPLKIGILNLMPTKIVTETQILRLLSNTPLQIDITLISAASHTSKNTSAEHLSSFYKTFDEVKDETFDGLLITGAPLEFLEFEQVDYWAELEDIIKWSHKNVYSTLYICWGALAGLYCNYGINKHKLEKKISGVYMHKTLMPSHPLVRGFDEFFPAPHSRFSYVEPADVIMNPDLQIIASSDEAGLYLVCSKSGREVYVFGHSEYDSDTLAKEYFRDLEKGIDPDIPKNYFPNDDPRNVPRNTWRSHAHLLYSNWLNYFVYQRTPYDIREIVKS